MNPDLKTPSTEKASEANQEVKTDAAPVAVSTEQSVGVESPAQLEEPTQDTNGEVKISPSQPQNAEATEEPKLSSNVVDLRTPEGEAEKAAAEEAKQKALQEQAKQSTVIAANNVGDIKPPTAQLSEADLSNNTGAGEQAPLQTGTTAETQSNVPATQPAKKPGFLARLFGKK